MPFFKGPEITTHYDLQGTTGDLLVLINGLADDLSTWDYQVPAFLAAGYRVLRYDNRGIGKSSAPPGPYTSSQLATDLHNLLTGLLADGGVSSSSSQLRFHLLGVSMGGMIAQSYALAYPSGSPAAGNLSLLSLSLCCTYAEPSTFCSRMFALWADMAVRMSVQDVMRDVTLWAFTVPFFRTREAELREVEKAMEGLEMSVEAYLSQLNVIQRFDSTGALAGLEAEGRVLGGLKGAERVLVLAGRTDVLIPVVLSQELAQRVVGSRFVTVKGGHGCLWEFPDEFNKAVIEFLDEFRESK